MSKRSQMIDYLRSLPPGDGEYTPLDLNKMAQDLGMNRDRVGSTLSAMASLGQIEWLKETKQPMRIIGFKNLNPSANAHRNEKRKSRKVKGTIEHDQQMEQETAKPVVSVRPTPELEQVASVHSAMEAFVNNFPGMVDEARVKEALRFDPDKVSQYVDEGVYLLERNRWLVNRNRELGDRLRQAERELGYLRAKNDQKLREGLVGAGVVHANDKEDR